MRRAAPGAGATAGRDREIVSMRRAATVAALVALVALAAPLAVPGVASAELREFRGKVGKISDTEIIVDNRKGDKMRFEPAGDVAVEGKKDAWSLIEKADWVLVSWDMMDNPFIAYKVVVLGDPDDDDDEDESAQDDD